MINLAQQFLKNDRKLAALTFQLYSKPLNSATKSCLSHDVLNIVCNSPIKIPNYLENKPEIKMLNVQNILGNSVYEFAKKINFAEEKYTLYCLVKKNKYKKDGSRRCGHVQLYSEGFKKHNQEKLYLDFSIDRDRRVLTFFNPQFRSKGSITSLNETILSKYPRYEDTEAHLLGNIVITPTMLKWFENLETQTQILKVQQQVATKLKNKEEFDLESLINEQKAGINPNKIIDVETKLALKGINQDLARLKLSEESLLDPDINKDSTQEINDLKIKILAQVLPLIDKELRAEDQIRIIKMYTQYVDKTGLINEQWYTNCILGMLNFLKDNVCMNEQQRVVVNQGLENKLAPEDLVKILAGKFNQ